MVPGLCPKVQMVFLRPGLSGSSWVPVSGLFFTLSFRHPRHPPSEERGFTFGLVGGFVWKFRAEAVLQAGHAHQLRET